MFTRSSGILLHPTSLPGKYGIGTLGEEAKKFIDFLEKSNQKLWQIGVATRLLLRATKPL